MICLHPFSSVLIGNSGMEAIKLLENLKFVLNKIGEYVPGGDANIRSVNLFCAMSPICLPIYHCGGEFYRYVRI